MSYLKVNEIITRVGDVAFTKFAIELLADAIQEQVNDGLLDPLELAIKFNGLEQLVKSVKTRITENVLAELMKHPKGKAEVLGASVSQIDSVKYDFTDLAGWLELEEQIIMLKEKQKDIEDKEKTYHKGNLPVKSVTSTFKIQLSK